MGLSGGLMYLSSGRGATVQRLNEREIGRFLDVPRL
jgi:hypothetical protein